MTNEENKPQSGKRALFGILVFVLGITLLLVVLKLILG